MTITTMQDDEHEAAAAYVHPILSMLYSTPFISTDCMSIVLALLQDDTIAAWSSSRALSVTQPSPLKPSMCLSLSTTILLLLFCVPLLDTNVGVCVMHVRPTLPRGCILDLSSPCTIVCASRALCWNQ